MNSLFLAAATALLTLLFALFLAYGQRLRPGKLVNFSVRLAGMGYAIPGLVIAIGVIIPFAWFDNTLDSWMRYRFNFSTGLLLSGTVPSVVRE